MVEINGVQVPAEIDSGTKITMINERMADVTNLELEPYAGNTRYCGAGGEDLQVRNVGKGMLKMGEWCEKIPFVVSKRLNAGILIGTDIIRAYGMIIDYNNMKLYTGTGDNCIPIWSWSQPIPIENVLLVKDVSLSHLPNDMRVKYEELLDEFDDVFSKDDRDIGNAPTLVHDIVLTDNKPFKAPTFRPFNCNRKLVSQHVNEMLEMNVIRPSKSCYSSPLVVVPKGDGAWRICLDSRYLNSITLPDNYGMKIIQDQLDKLRGSKVFSDLDLTSGYWQFHLTERAIPLTAFQCDEGLFEYIRMPFGLCNAGATFQRHMDQILKDIEDVLTYIDDILAHSRNHEEHLVVLRKVFGRLRAVGLKLKGRKCHFGKAETKFLGYIVNGDGVRMNPEKVETIRNYPEPRTARQLRKWLGMISQYRQYIQDYVQVNEPLQKAALLTVVDAKTKKRVKNNFRFTAECREAFIQVKELLCKEPIMLFHPDPERRFRVITDASKVGLGATLVQEIDGSERVVFYASRVLVGAEKNYSTIERELLAVKWAVKKFRCYLYANEFDVFTDHKPLCHTKTAKNLSERMMKWILELEEYQIMFYYRPGKLNVVADVLSRISEPIAQEITWYERKKSLEQLKAENAMATTSRLKLYDGNEEENESEEIVILWISAGEETNVSEFVIDQENDETVKALSGSNKISRDEQGRFFLCAKERFRLIVPVKYRKQVLSGCHESGGHLGMTKTFKKVAERFYWPALRNEVLEWVASCPLCNRMKVPKIKSEPKQIPLPTVRVPFDRLALDFIGPLPTTDKGNKHILVCVDYCTRWPEAFATRDQLATTVAEIIVNEIVCRHGAPREILTDQGQNFRSQLVTEVCNFLRTRKLLTAPYKPSTNGLCERLNQSLMQILKIMVVENKRNWDRLLPAVLFCYRTACQESTNFSPAKLLYGRELRLPMELDMYAPRLVEIQKLKGLWIRAQEGVEKVAERNKARHDKKSKEPSFHAGDMVRLRMLANKVGESPKLKVQWSEPVLVLDVFNNNAKVKVNGKEKVVSMQNIKMAEKKREE